MFLNLATEIKKAGLSQKEFSQRVKINAVVFSRKLNGDSDWKLSEIRRILEFWNLKLSFDYLFENIEVQQVG